MFKTRLRLMSLELERAGDRRRFVCRTIIQLVVFQLLAFVQWILLVAFHPNSMKDSPIRSLESTFVLLFFVSLLFYLVFAVSTQLRVLSCINWIVTLLILECLIVSIAVLAARTNWVRLLVSYVCVTILMVLASLTAFFLNHDITKHVRTLYLWEFCMFVFSIYVVSFHVILELSWPYFLYAVVIVIMVLPILVYHVQTILGNGEERTALTDDKLAALLLFHDFLALLMLTFYWRPTRSDNQ